LSEHHANILHFFGKIEYNLAYQMGDIMDMDTSKDRPKISVDERARRKAAIDYGRGSVRLEGFVVSDHAEELNRRYINGEISSAEHSAAIRSHYGL
jgi:hypothetical protein